jgi:hypothetical protein
MGRFLFSKDTKEQPFQPGNEAFFPGMIGQEAIFLGTMSPGRSIRILLQFKLSRP